MMQDKNRKLCIVYCDRDGVTLIELIIVIAIIGIIILFATIDTAWFQKDARVAEARDRLLADIEDAKLKSLAQVPHGIVIISATSYKMVKLNDKGRCSLTTSTACFQVSDCPGGETCDLSYRNFEKDAGESTSDILNSTVTLSTNVKVSLSSGTGTELWFDRKGIPRTSTWTMDGNCSATTATVCDEDTNCPAGETCNRTFTVWYDTNGNGSVDADEPNKTITIYSGGKVKYEQ